MYQIFLNFMKDLTLCTTQVATVLILFDVVLVMWLSISTKYETKELIAILSSMILLKKLIPWLFAKKKAELIISACF